MIEPEIQYCPDCGWNTYQALFPGPNGLVQHRYCSFCGWFGRDDDKGTT